MHCAANVPSLVTLEIETIADVKHHGLGERTPVYTFLAPFIDRLRLFSHQLAILRITLLPSRTGYGTSRHDILKILGSKKMIRALEKKPGLRSDLRQFRICVYEHPASMRAREEWWQIRLLTKLPAIKDNLTVDVRPCACHRALAAHVSYHGRRCSQIQMPIYGPP